MRDVDPGRSPKLQKSNFKNEKNTHPKHSTLFFHITKRC